MAKGLFLSVGLNRVDPAAYGGWAGPLTACEADAKDVADIAVAMGHTGDVLLTAAATRSAVLAKISAAALTLSAGDLFVLFYSGHGGQLPDLDGDEDDDLDETWCLYDGQLVDDEIYAALGAFQAGVRIFSMSDSCHSGTVLKSALLNVAISVGGYGQRAMPIELALSVYQANKGFYDPILQNPALKKAADNIQASAILISGCMDNQLSADGPFNGRFTGRVKRVWNGGQFGGDYRRFWKDIMSGMPSDQTPNFFKVGPDDPTFEASKPFKI